MQDASLTQISLELGKHGILSMERYLRHFALVMILVDRGLNSRQMQSVVGISESLIAQYSALYEELNVPEYARTLERLKRSVFTAGPETDTAVPAEERPQEDVKGGPQ